VVRWCVVVVTEVAVAPVPIVAVRLKFVVVAPEKTRNGVRS